MIKLYMKGSVCDADLDQVDTMLKAGWSKKPTPKAAEKPIPKAAPKVAGKPS